MSRTIDISGRGPAIGGEPSKEPPQLNPVLPPLSAVIPLASLDSQNQQPMLRIPEPTTKADFASLVSPTLMRLIPESSQGRFMRALQRNEAFSTEVGQFMVTTRTLPSGSLRLEFQPLNPQPESNLSFECRVDPQGNSAYIRLSGDRQVAERITAAEFFSILRN